MHRRLVAHHRLPAAFGFVHGPIPLEVVHHVRADPSGELLDQLPVVRQIFHVGDQTTHAHVAFVGVVLDPARDVVGGIQAHELAGSHDVHFLGVAGAHRHGEAAADDVSGAHRRKCSRSPRRRCSCPRALRRDVPRPRPAQPTPGLGPPTSMQSTFGPPSITMSLCFKPVRPTLSRSIKVMGETS